MLAHLLVDMWRRAGPATSFSLACVLLKRRAAPPWHAVLRTQQQGIMLPLSAMSRGHGQSCEGLCVRSPCHS